MLVQISVGEAVDKLCVLELKNEMIKDIKKKEEINKEILGLADCFTYKQRYEYYYKLLMYVNRKIWNMTDEIKSMTIDNGHYAKVAFDIFEFNQRRYRLKNFFNILCDSHLKEQKSYGSTNCRVLVDKEETLYSKIPEISYLTLEYDQVGLELQYFSTIKNILTAPNIILLDGINEITADNTIILNSFNLDSSLRYLYELPTISYIIGGMFGDFINQLSIINENFYKTGRKGILYIADVGDHFKYGVDFTYNDTYEVISSQKYIRDYKKHTGEHIDIDLTSWRTSKLIYHSHWHDIYKSTYNLPWGTHRWLCVPHDPKWQDIVLVNMTGRFGVSIDYQKLYHLYGNKLMFITAEINDYMQFRSRAGINVPNYVPKSFTDLCIAINSCKFFVAGISAPLCISNALHKSTVIALLSDTDTDNNFYRGLDKVLPNIRYNVDFEDPDVAKETTP